ncbi:MAG: D-3-phosphoglycerate dehydrogenase [Chlamydiae bacterium]|nr:D-3-phosphoglycerate dehydrogenase [Chlamydiota bacterium]
MPIDKTKMKVLLLEGVDKSAAEVFQKNGYTNIETISSAINDETLIEKLQDTTLLGIRSRTNLNEELISQAPNLLAIGCYCIGTNQVALQQAALKGVPVFNAPHSNTRSVAELVIGLTIMLMRNVFPKNAAAHEGKWLKDAKASHEVRGKVIGIVGYGHIGSQVSVLAESFGMQVVYYDIFTKLPLGNAKPLGSLEELLKVSDIVTLHVPEARDTKNMMNQEHLNMMKEGSCLINASRGSVVDITALKECMDKGKIKAAALDVFPQEPENASNIFESPMRGKPNVILTPHIAGSTLEAQRNIGIEVSQKLIYYSDRGSTEGAVNFPAINLPLHIGMHRILHIHQNIPGMLQQINKAIADEKSNVQSQYLLTNQEVGYVVLDIENKVSDNLRKTLRNIEGTIRMRVLY